MMAINALRKRHIFNLDSVYMIERSASINSGLPTLAALAPPLFSPKGMHGKVCMVRCVV